MLGELLGGDDLTAFGITEGSTVGLVDGVLLGIALGVRDVSVVGYDEWVIVGSPEG